MMRLPVLLRSVWFELNRNFRTKLEDSSITSVQYTVLRCIYENNAKEISQNELAEMVSSNENNLVSVLQRLEKLELVQRRRSPKDSRCKLVFMTDKGVSEFLQAQKKATQVKEEIANGLADEELDFLIGFLERIEANLIELK